MKLRVKDIMTKRVVTIDPFARICDAARLMKSTGVRFLLVTQGDRPVGVITDRDILTKVVANGFSARRKQVREFMTPKPACVASEATTGEATKLMRDLQLRHLPVVENERLVGILSVADLASVLFRNSS